MAVGELRQERRVDSWRMDGTGCTNLLHVARCDACRNTHQLQKPIARWSMWCMLQYAPIAKACCLLWCDAQHYCTLQGTSMLCIFYCMLHCPKINCASSTRAATKLRWEKNLGSRELSIHFNPYQTTGKIWLHVCYICAPKRKMVHFYQSW